MTISTSSLVRTLAVAAVVLGAGLSAQAQTWNGFYLGGQVYEDWANVPQRFKVFDPNKTPLGTQIVPVFSIKW